MTSLYRKWRSRSFDDLYGQDHVVRTLRNAVREHRVAHAYLFTGPRGTGKTSAARILAKAVNCLNPEDGNPCTVCEACLAAQEGRALDVIEIDAASNTSVENVRDLRERVGYAAGEGGYKVYIVDEVHRLSGAAFDAFLKTLEEPPPHVIFVFASTEPHKVPATIASRCQRFDFRRISPTDTLVRLREVATHESMEASDGALALIARNANGSLRDALGLLEQASSYSDGEIDEAHIRQTLGMADPTLVSRMSDHLLDGDTGKGLEAADGFFAQGGDPQQLMTQLIEYWRALLLATAGTRRQELVIDPALEEDLRRHAGVLDPTRVVAVLRALNGNEFSAKYDVTASLPLEMGYVQASLALAENRPQPRSTEAAVTAETRSRPADGPAPRTLPETEKPNVRPAEPEPAPPAPIARTDTTERSRVGAETGDYDRMWANILSRMRAKNLSLQAMLRSGYLLKAGGGQVTIGFLYDFHASQFADSKKRRVLEEVVAEVLGSSHRVQCVRATKEEIEAARGAGSVEEDDGFVDEVAEKLRQYHARQISNGNS